MNNKIVEMIKRWPTFYRFITWILSLDFLRLRESLISSRLTERWWAADSYSEGFWGSKDHPSRHFLVEMIAKFSPMRSILEVGCGGGANLYLLAQRFPETQFVGIDINPEAIEYGRQHFAQAGISNVSMLASKADELEQFEDKVFDIVYTRAVLAHVPPRKITNVTKDMVRVAKRALILMELHDFEPKTREPWLATYRGRTWLRDYVALLKQFVPEEQIRVTKLTEDIWSGGKALIEVSVASG